MRLRLTDKVAKITDCNRHFVGQGNVYRDLDSSDSFVHIEGRNISIGYLTTRKGCRVEFVKHWDASPSNV